MEGIPGLNRMMAHDPRNRVVTPRSLGGAVDSLVLILAVKLVLFEIVLGTSNS